MKGNKKLLVVAALLLVIAVGYSTYAIYKSSVTAEATVDAAAWQIKFKDGQTEITQNYEIAFTSSECTSAHVAAGKIAPGATCNKVITLDATGTEVDVTYTATAGTVTAASGETPVSTSGANAFTASISGGTGTIYYSSNDQTATLTLTVAWAGTDDTGVATPEVVNPADTLLAGTTIKVPVTLVAKQVPATNS